MAKVTCPYCEGFGQTKDWADDVYGNTISFYLPCECCEGEGEVDETEVDSIKEIFPKSNRELIKEIDGE